MIVSQSQETIVIVAALIRKGNIHLPVLKLGLFYNKLHT